VETEAAVEEAAEAVATVRVKTNITILRIHSKINVIKVASNNMAITNKWAPRVKTQDKGVTVRKCKISSNNNRISFSYPKLTFPTLTKSLVKRERTSSETVFIPPSKPSLEIKLPESLLVCSWTSPPSTQRSFSQTTLSSSARSTRPTPST
jgi:hypothetical protein